MGKTWCKEVRSLYDVECLTNHELDNIALESLGTPHWPYVAGTGEAIQIPDTASKQIRNQVWYNEHSVEPVWLPCVPGAV